MKLINEVSESISTEILSEDTSKPKAYKIKGPFIHCEDVNRNGRMYMKEHIVPEVSRYINEYVNTRRALGELSHPESPTINPDRVSHIITKLEWQDNLCMGEATILDTVTGKTLKSFIDGGVSFGVSTRGLGTVKESNGVKVVQPDFKLVTVDAVLDPSGRACFSEGILESKEWIFVEGLGWVEQFMAESKKTLQKAKAKDVEPIALQIFENFLKKL